MTRTGASRYAVTATVFDGDLASSQTLHVPMHQMQHQAALHPAFSACFRLSAFCILLYSDNISGSC
jgi:hypothetical protein